MPKGRPSKKKLTQEKQVVEKIDITCFRCGCKNQDKFYKVKDPTREHFGRVCYCKDCVKQIYDGYLKKYKGNIFLALYYMCRKVDLPYIHLAAQSAVENINNPNAKIQGEDAMVSAYMKNIAFADTNGWGTNFDDSQGISQIPDIEIYEEIIKVRKRKKEEIKKNEDKYEYIEYDTDELIAKWGEYEPDDLSYLESEYLDWEDKLNGINEKSMEIMVIEVCRQCLDIRKDRESNVNVDKKVKTLQDLLKSSGLIEAQNKLTEKRSVGMSIDEIEFHRPIVEPDPDLVDVDGNKERVCAYVASVSRVFARENAYTNMFDKTYGKYSIDLIDDLNKQKTFDSPNLQLPESTEEVQLVIEDIEVDSDE